jgi:hypothetical protein
MLRPVHLYISGSSFIAGCGYVKGWGHESTLILGTEVWSLVLSFVWEKLYTPAGS